MAELFSRDEEKEEEEEEQELQVMRDEDEEDSTGSNHTLTLVPAVISIKSEIFCLAFSDDGRWVSVFGRGQGWQGAGLWLAVRSMCLRVQQYIQRTFRPCFRLGYTPQQCQKEYLSRPFVGTVLRLIPRKQWRWQLESNRNQFSSVRIVYVRST